MCGILALYSKKMPASQNAPFFNKMLSLLNRRGPDKMVRAELGPLTLGHTRLSIIDLVSGDQPVYNEDNTIAVILNGEIYNFLEVREELTAKGHLFKTNSDAEVIAHLYEEYGENFFEKLNGMFAFVVYDQKKDVLIAARDRMGEKPLIYSLSKDFFVITSELKTMSEFPFFDKRLNIESIYLYLNSLYIPAPNTIYQSLKKLLPAHYLKFQNGELTIKKYYNPKISIHWDADENDICQKFQSLFQNVVKLRMVSDVPLGAFLSGGIDSSSIVASMAKANHQEIKTFSVGLDGYVDERRFAKMVSEKFRTTHTDIVVNANIRDAFCKVMRYFDEPFGDSSAIPTYLISAEARKYVKVILGGDGGDELFAGYAPYIWQKYSRNNRIESGLYRRANQLMIKKFKKGLFDKILYKKRGSANGYADWRKIRSFLREEEIGSMLKNPLENIDIDGFYKQNEWFATPPDDALSIAYYQDINNYLPDDLLKKVDMASMMCGLETRSPFLDHRLVEFAMSIPPHMKLKNDVTKYVLRKALKGTLPPRILSRGKYGFGGPIVLWMKNDLKEMIMDLLSKGCRCDDLFKRSVIDESINAVFSKKTDVQFDATSSRLWMIFILEWWLRNNNYAFPG